MKSVTAFTILAVFLVVSCEKGSGPDSGAPSEDKSLNLSDEVVLQLAQVQKEQEMTDEELADALSSWCRVHHLGGKLGVEGWFFETGEFTDEEVSQILLDMQELTAEHKEKVYFAAVEHVMILRTLLVHGEEAAADGLRESIAREYRKQKKVNDTPENQFIRTADITARDDPKLRQALDREGPAEQGADQPAAPPELKVE